MLPKGKSLLFYVVFFHCVLLLSFNWETFLAIFNFKTNLNFPFFTVRLHPMSGIGAAFALMQRDRPVSTSQMEQQEPEPEEEAV